MATPRGAVLLLEGIVVGLLPLLHSRLHALRVKTQALASADAGDGDGLVASLLGGIVLERLTFSRQWWFCLLCYVAMSDGLEDVEAAASGRWL
jgi:hypothetical protein